MRVVAVIGTSNSGKTRLICALIRHFVTSGQTVAAIKHTHHALNEQKRGDTATFSRAGAAPVILAGECEAVLFAETTRRIPFADPSDLLAYLPADVVLVEGFTQFDGWPRIEAAQAGSLQDALALLDRIA